MTRGSKVVEGRIEKKFELQDDVGQKFKTLVQDVPYKTILVSEEIIDYIKTQSTKRINDSIYVTLTDQDVYKRQEFLRPAVRVPQLRGG